MIAEISTGRVRGVARPDGVTAFLGVPYADAERFAAPRPVRPWSGVRDAVAPGPAAPQRPSRLERVMGGFEVPQDERCLSLNVWTPAGGGPARPVLVFLHGGGFTSGSGGLGWYDGAEFAARGDVVVVTVNYRLGVLGFLRLPAVSPGNLGLLDQLTALRWIRDHIAAFGGDPANVTVAGQSAGAQSILALLSRGRARGLFRRAILQSTPAGMLPDSPADAERTGHILLDELGIEPGEAARLRVAPADALVSALGAVARRTAVPLNPAPPFQLVADDDLVAPDPVAAVGAPTADGVDVLMGTTRDEAAAFFPGDDRAVETVTGQMFLRPSLRLARLLTGHGNAPWSYRFDWHPRNGPFGACHCIELPFILGSADAWRDAPMLADERPRTLVDETRRAWTGFVRDGDPGWARGTTRHFTG
ncbi:carboxylesterase family protein [Actinomadura kijaniata]|uniref:Carboxylic ester hydrolase n=1 Tax=Actinomadura namibiensis TaxID=182080 RepID=A0A7W3QPC5_ACTNM|nr:carboxylesterase family protein [Actinomadura namibiensis]MBA8954507.1 para-nitrobenzyl esterase [Actinomadura namibiensis]